MTRRLWRAGLVVLAALWVALPAASVRAASPDDGDDQLESANNEAAARNRSRQRRFARHHAQRWSGSVGVLVGRCLRQSHVLLADGETEVSVPCSPDLDTESPHDPLGFAVGFDAAVAYEVTRRLTVSGDLFYEPIPQTLFPEALVAYDVPFRKDATWTSSFAVATPFGAGATLGDPTTLTVSEGLELTPPRWLVFLSVYGDADVGSAKSAEEGTLQRHVGALAQVSFAVSRRLDLGGSLNATARTDSGATGDTLLEATPIEATYSFLGWSHTLSLNVAAFGVDLPASVSLEYAARWAF